MVKHAETKRQAEERKGTREMGRGDCVSWLSIHTAAWCLKVVELGLRHYTSKHFSLHSTHKQEEPTLVVCQVVNKVTNA